MTFQEKIQERRMAAEKIERKVFNELIRDMIFFGVSEKKLLNKYRGRLTKEDIYHLKAIDLEDF